MQLHLGNGFFPCFWRLNTPLKNILFLPSITFSHTFWLKKGGKGKKTRYLYHFTLVSLIFSYFSLQHSFLWHVFCEISPRQLRSFSLRAQAVNTTREHLLLLFQNLHFLIDVPSHSEFQLVTDRWLLLLLFCLLSWLSRWSASALQADLSSAQWFIPLPNRLTRPSQQNLRARSQVTLGLLKSIVVLVKKILNIPLNISTTSINLRNKSTIMFNCCKF